MKARIWSHQSWVESTDSAQLRRHLASVLDQAGFTTVGFNEAHFEPHGYTAVWILAESHLAVHTFPEASRSYCELASCNREKFVAYLSLMENWEVN